MYLKIKCDRFFFFGKHIRHRKRVHTHQHFVFLRSANGGGIQDPSFIRLALAVSSPRLVLLRSALVSFGLGLGFARARLGGRNRLLAFGVVQGLLQGPRSRPQARAWVTFTPTPKAILTVRSEVLLPVARHFAFHLSGLLVARALPKARTAVAVARDTVAIAPVAAF